MPNQVYRFDQNTSAVRVVADGFNRCNGLAFTGDGKIAYVYVFPLRYSSVSYISPNPARTLERLEAY